MSKLSRANHSEQESITIFTASSNGVGHEGSTLPVRIYRPDQNLGWGYGVWRDLSLQLWQGRELIWRFFLREFSARYRQSALGVTWTVLSSVLPLGVFVLLYNAGVLNVGETRIPYPAYALLGLTIWQFFASGLNAASNSIIASGSLVTKINFPKITLVVASLGQPVVELIIRFVLLGAVFAWYRVIPEWAALLLPIILVPLALLTLGLGLLFSLLNTLLRDIGQIVGLATTVLMLVTPVLYSDPGFGFISVISTYNPMATLITAARDLVIVGGLTQPERLLWTSILSLAAFLIAWRIFALSEPRIAERV